MYYLIGAIAGIVLSVILIKIQDWIMKDKYK